jgi:N-methylhydantoinase B
MLTQAQERILPEIIEKGLIFASEEMGIALRNSSFSPNIKERMDHSCAIFDALGDLLAQAEHIPVHLGSLPLGLRNVLEFLSKHGCEMEKGSMVIANDPYITGTHLNDITLIRPVYFGRSIVAYVANKAHHSDIGGIIPGSMSSSATQLEDEGIVIRPKVLVREDLMEDKVSKEIASRTRMPKVCLGDLNAQVAANMTGERRVLELVSKYGRELFESSTLDFLEKNEFLIRDYISSNLSGRAKAVDYLESRSGKLLKLKVRVVVDRRKGEIFFDYSGTCSQVREPLNAVLGVTLSGVYYVMKCITDPMISVNEGFFKAIKVRVPRGSILNPIQGHPVSGGNVETSQRNADLLFRALSRIRGAPIIAASQGTMNNVMFGCDSWAFYETVGGGMGARPGKDGIDGIQCHMTNTLNTPVEHLESAFPILVTQYSFREDSPGAGEFRGGCGIIRSWKIEKDEPSLCFTIISERQIVSPWGERGGKPGECGKVWLKRAVRMQDESREEGTKMLIRLSSKETIRIQKGDEIILETPGGGGYGRPSNRSIQSVKKDLEDEIISLDYANRYYPTQLKMLKKNSHNF